MLHPAAGALPPGWVDHDVGAPPLAGSADYTNGVWSVAGSGTGTGNAGDQLNFLATHLWGDGAVLARVIGQSATHPGAATGIMIRHDSGPGSPQVSLLVSPGAGLTLAWRAETDGATNAVNVPGITPPVYLRLSRSNAVVRGAYSIDGLTWTPAGSAGGIAADGDVLAGLATDAGDPGTINTGRMSCTLVVPGPQTDIPPDLHATLCWQSTWPLPQIDTASNAPLPKMGWNSWFVFGDQSGPTETGMLAMADALVDSGLAAAGYRCVVMDCTWIANGRGCRDTNGFLIPDPERWPHGMKYISDYVHSKGLLMGGYSDIGTLGWGNPSQIGSYAYYQQDADQFAGWGWDFIKVDDHGPGDFYALSQAMANNALGRPIALSLSTGNNDALKFAPRIANSFRVAFDITLNFGYVTWPDILREFNADEQDWYAQSPGHWNDPDMLCTGFYGISDTEGRTMFNMWSILGAPLMIGTDVRTNGISYTPPLSAATLSTLTNREVIAVDQDPLGAVGRPVAPGVYAKALGSFTSGQYAVLLVNFSSSPASVSVTWNDLGFVPGTTAAVRDLWAHASLGETMPHGYVSPVLEPHASMMLKVAGTFDWSRPQTREAESGYNTLGGTAYYVPHDDAFSATAYVAGVGDGPGNLLQFNDIAAPSNGLYEIAVYYACATNRTAQLTVNDSVVASLTFPATGSDSQVEILPLSVQLTAGRNHLRFSNDTGPAPRFDKLVAGPSLGPSDLAATAADGRVSLGWRAPRGLVCSLYRSTTSGAEGNDPIAVTQTNAWVDSDVTNGQTYYYVVTYFDPIRQRQSPPSNEASARPRATTTSTAYRDSVLALDPAAYWRFNETNGSLAKDSAGAHDAAYGPNVGLGVPGPRPADFLGFETTNTAARFFAVTTNSWVTTPPLNLDTNRLTITCWIYPLSEQAPYAGLFFCRGGGTVAGLNYSGIAGDNGRALGYTWNNNYAAFGWYSGLVPPIDQWSFAALAVDPGRAVLYLINTDGQQTATNVLNHPIQTFSIPSTIGIDNHSPPSREFHGDIDEVAIFPRTLTPDEIQHLYAAGHRLPEVRMMVRSAGSGLILTWPQGTLFEAESLAGPWTRLTNAVSPYAVSPTASRKFYRVLLQQ